MRAGVKPGDWVTSYSPGIWQVYRVLEAYRTRDPVTGLEVTRTPVFSKRMVSAALKKVFNEECCEPEHVKKLSGKLLRQSGRLLMDLERLAPSTIFRQSCGAFLHSGDRSIRFDSPGRGNRMHGRGSSAE